MTEPSDTPLTVLDDVFSEEDLRQVETRTRAVPNLPKVIALGDLQTPCYGNDPSELIKNRFFYRKGILLIVGPTGIGKSSFGMQLVIYLAIGKTLFGIRVGEVYHAKGMRILFIQAENDEGDLAEMRDGVLRGCADLTPEEKQKAQENILTVTLNDRTGEAFAETMEELLVSEGPFDLVMVDPVFSFIQGDTNSNRDVSDFVRNQITPIIHRQDVGLILVHHTAKPSKGREKDNWSGNDMAYLGTGASEFANAARAVIAIRSVGSYSVYQLLAAKRGRRLGWEDEGGNPSYSKHIAHHGEPGVICWREAKDEEVLSVMSPKIRLVKKAPVYEILNLIREYPEQNQNWYIQQALPRFGCTSNTIQARITELCADKLAEGHAHGRERRYRITAAGSTYLQGKDLKINWAGLSTGEGS
jgi:hypothetical protein